MNTDKISCVEIILIAVYVLGSLSALVYFLHTVMVLFYPPVDFAAQLELFL
jgi:hypothetical protein